MNRDLNSSSTLSAKQLGGQQFSVEKKYNIIHNIWLVGISVIIFFYLKYFLRQYQVCCHNHRPTYTRRVLCSYNNIFKVF